VLRRPGCSVRPTRRRVSSMCARRRFRRAQTSMEVGGAMSSPRGCQWRAAELGRRLGMREERSGTYLYSCGRSVASLWGHPDDRSTCGVGGNARRRAVAPAANGVWRRCICECGLATWHHPSGHGRHAHEPAGAAHGPLDTPAPQRARPTRVRCVQRRGRRVMPRRDVVRGSSVCTISLIYLFFLRIFSRFQNRSGPNFEYQSCPTSYHLQKCQRI
jgi:hypothetical protein